MNQPIATCPAGTFRGLNESGVDVWRGIRYAEAPTGEFRWRSPRPAAPADVDAFEFGAVAPQLKIPFIALGESAVLDEDCLFLNVWRQAGTESGAKPVMVWLHGGAYALGSGSQDLYDGAAMATNQEVVVVTINYRLGALGFLDLFRFSTPDHRFDGNLALRDALLGLQWVRANIAAFGGDPDRVTVAGESAGAGLVTALLACPSAEGLFHRAIAQSSPASSMYGPDRAAEVAERFLRHVGVTADRIAELRGLSAQDVVEATMAVYADVPNEAPGTLAFAPVIDGDLLPESPVEAARAGRTHPVPLLIGTNRDEATLFAKMSSPIMPVDRERILKMFGDIRRAAPDIELPSIEDAQAHYGSLRPKHRGLAVARDIGFRLPTVWLADAHSASAPVWLYRFDYATPALRLIGLGASHATDLPYVWGKFSGPDGAMLKLGGRRTAFSISRRMQSRWGAFIRGESPNTDGAIEWPQYREPDADVLIIDRKDRVESAPDAEMLALWGNDVIAFP